MTFVRQIAKVAGQPSSIRVGTIVSTNPLQLQVQDTVYSSDAVGVLGSYFPVTGDVVSVVGQSNNSSADPTSWLILGTNTEGNIGFQSGQVLLSFGPATSFTRAVMFARPFALFPTVVTNINSGAGSTASWGSRGINMTESGFTLFVFGPSATWTNVAVQWLAVSRNQ